MHINLRIFEERLNDFDFISSRNLPKADCLESIQALKTSYVDSIVGKLNYNNSTVEILFAKYIPTIFCKQKENVIIPDFHWMIAMKITQSIKLYLLKNDKKIFQMKKFKIH